MVGGKRAAGGSLCDIRPWWRTSFPDGVWPVKRRCSRWPTGRRGAWCVVAPVQTLSPASDQVGYRPTWRILMSSGSHSYRGQMCVCNFGTKLPWISKLIRRSRSGWSAPQSRLTIAACALRRRLSSPRKASLLRRSVGTVRVDIRAVGRPRSCCTVSGPPTGPRFPAEHAAHLERMSCRTPVIRRPTRNGSQRGRQTAQKIDFDLTAPRQMRT